MELPVILESQNAMNAADGATTERRIRINRPDDENTKCKVSRAWDPRKDFSQCMQRPRTPSTSSAISPQQERTEPSGHRPCIHGTKSSLRREPNGPGDLLRALFGNVTEPLEPFFQEAFLPLEDADHYYNEEDSFLVDDGTIKHLTWCSSRHLAKLDLSKPASCAQIRIC